MDAGAFVVPDRLSYRVSAHLNNPKENDNMELRENF
jgi:hypothetical protein